MRAPVVQGAQVSTALADLLESNVTLPNEESDVLQVAPPSAFVLLVFDLSFFAVLYQFKQRQLVTAVNLSASSARAASCRAHWQF